MKTDNEKYNFQVTSATSLIQKLKENLPEFFSKDGRFDLEKLSNQLKEQNVDELRDGYQLSFIGKDYARRQVGERPTSVVVPNKEWNSNEGELSENLFFTGDNLEVLRHLQNAYSNSIDVIYIDPPYNTGSDEFAYPDTFEYTDDKLISMFGLDDDSLTRLKSIQGKASHSAWLTFMYPRLMLAKRLLSTEGVMFVSIDDNEAADLRLLMNDIFGEANFVMQISWRRTDNQPNIGRVAKVKEYILMYAKNISASNIGTVPLSTKALNEYRYSDDKGKFRRGILLDKTRGRFNYPLKTQSGKVINGPWKISKEDFKALEEKNLVYWTKSGLELPYKKTYLKDSNGVIPNDFWGIEVGTNQRASAELMSLMGKRYFAFPKPTSLIKQVLRLSANKDAVVMDFFAGSGTTADAVMQLNSEDGGHRKFIMVQQAEKTFEIDKESGKQVPTKGGRIAYKDGYLTVDQISRDRIYLAAKKINENTETVVGKSDNSFKHYSVIHPSKHALENIDDFDPKSINLFTNMVNSFSSESLSVSGGASGEQVIMATWLLQDGYSLNANITKIFFESYGAYNIEKSRLYLIAENWGKDETKILLNQLGTHKLNIQSVVVFGYSFNIAELRELENGLKQLDRSVSLIRRY
ncbi:MULTISPECIES: site-specific DNA-methyltransferase [Levilactobacillus]|uniref:site-specific DNA-methyltransferase n=1 Tax=Levilactobacillus TaxID=2767886 RepID=UPI003757AF7E